MHVLVFKEECWHFQGMLIFEGKYQCLAGNAGVWRKMFARGKEWHCLMMENQGAGMLVRV